MKYIVIMIMAALIMGCNPDTKNTAGAKSSDNTAEKAVPSKGEGSFSTKDKVGQTPPPAKNSKKIKVSGKISNYNSDGVPDACDLVSAATLAKYLNVDAGSITLNDGSGKKNTKSRACFFKWDGADIRNAGVMVQVQKNQVVEDVPDYFTIMIDSKITQGENDFRSDVIYKYKKWDGIGSAGAYSTDLGKYLWRVDNEWAFMVAFNTTLKPAEQKKAAMAFAQEVMSNMDL